MLYDITGPRYQELVAYTQDGKTQIYDMCTPGFGFTMMWPLISLAHSTHAQCALSPHVILITDL